MLKGAKQGNWQGARFVPFGYRYNKEKKLLIIYPEEAKIVKLIFKMYLEGKSVRDITNYLNKNEFKAREGKRFYNKFIGNILQRRIYIGQVVRKESLVSNIHQHFCLFFKKPEQTATPKDISPFRRKDFCLSGSRCFDEYLGYFFIYLYF